jgi:hypothetical protein
MGLEELERYVASMEELKKNLELGLMSWRRQATLHPDSWIWIPASTQRVLIDIYESICMN